MINPQKVAILIMKQTRQEAQIFPPKKTINSKPANQSVDDHIAPPIKGSPAWIYHLSSVGKFLYVSHVRW